MNRLTEEVPEEASTTWVRARAVAIRILGRIRQRGPVPSPLASEINLLNDGEIVAERYRVLRLIERGGVGQVYLVEDLELGEKVALKTLRPRFAEAPEAIENFSARFRSPGG